MSIHFIHGMSIHLNYEGKSVCYIIYIYLEQTKKDHKTRSKSQDGRKGKVGKAKIDRARKVTVAKHGTQERRE